MKYTSSIANSSIECVYKDVVIIGNGPSGITLSYMLAGNWPYWIGDQVKNHPDELLRARLTYADHKKSLVEQNLAHLADGLEGRSTNPVSLLLDSLQNPCADLGMEMASMLEYKYHPEKEIDHVVLGKGAPGGSWHRMDPNLRTLSLSAWMSLPGLDFNTWNLKHSLEANQAKRKSREESSSFVANGCKTCNAEHNTFSDNNDWWHLISSRSNSNQMSMCSICDADNNSSVSKSHLNATNDNASGNLQVNLLKDCTKTTQIVPTNVPRRILSVKRQISREVQTRAVVSKVAQYYESYVKEMNLERYFCNNTVVTAIKPLPMNSANKNARWLVKGVKSNGSPFAYSCRNVVLANGASDFANRLGLSGEDSASSWITHDLPALESALEKVPDAERSKMKPVLVVGAGLSAADAVTICRSSGINVIHVYRNRSAGLDKMLPETVYPEYHEVHKMMKDCTKTYDLYTPLPENAIIEFIPAPPNSSESNKIVLRQLNTGETSTIEVSLCSILIGFRPDLRFLSPVMKQLVKSNGSNKPDDLLKYENFDEITQLDANSPRVKEIQQPLSPLQQNLLSRKIAWLKNLCAKCKHLNLCERSRRHEYHRKLTANQHNQTRQCCECSNNLSKHSNNNDNNNNFNNNNCIEINDSKVDKCIAQSDDYEMLPLAIGIGEDPTKPIDCKTNPIGVDKFTNEVLHAPAQGLYAMGPLVGDNFIRFIPGGALAITSALHKLR